LEGAGASEWVIRQIEDMIMDHYYRVEANVFKLECGLKEQAQLAEEQKRSSVLLGERLSHLGAAQDSDRALIHKTAARIQELIEDGALTSKAPAMDATSDKTLDTSRPDLMEVDRSTKVLADLCRDFDAQMERHEHRFNSFERDMQHCCVQIRALRSELCATDSFSSARQPGDALLVGTEHSTISTPIADHLGLDQCSIAKVTLSDVIFQLPLIQNRLPIGGMKMEQGANEMMSRRDGFEDRNRSE
jgi:hypothetical protein